MEFMEIKGRLNRGLIHKSGSIDIDFGEIIIQKAKEISKTIVKFADNNKSSDRDLDKVRRFSKILDFISWCYPVSTKKVSAEKLDRRKSMFFGPFFTSIDYPWPEINGRYAEPIIQIKLEDISGLSSQKFGDGLLQVWGAEFASDDFLIRSIPEIELHLKNLSPIPGNIFAEYYGDVRWGSSMVAWPEPDYKKNSPCAYEISKIDLQKLSWPEGLEEELDWIESQIYDFEFISELKDFISIFPYKKPSTEPHFLGLFNAIQYHPVDVGRTFLALEGDPCFNWNYGNAQISYRLNDNGQVEFGFNWSCQ